jgi:hypothetical protein
MKLTVQETPTGREWTFTLTERETMNLSKSCIAVQCHAEKIPHEVFVLMMHAPGFVDKAIPTMSQHPECVHMLIALEVFRERRRIGRPKLESDYSWMMDDLKSLFKQKD